MVNNMISEQSKFLKELIKQSKFELKNEVDLYNNIDNISLYNTKKSIKITRMFERILTGHYLVNGNKRLAFQFLLHYNIKDKIFPKVSIDVNEFVDNYKKLVVSLENNRDKSDRTSLTNK
jgi:prophage maintenance system killer protein